jgi:signal peptide peptidase SppA
MQMNAHSRLSWLPFERFRNPPPVVHVVRLSGMIGGVGPWRRGLTLSGVAGTLQRAFKRKGIAAVALAINSPGGSAVQSALIARRIRALADEHKVPVLAFAEDIAASGGYWLATAADEIYADPGSIIGSIGVVSSGFGFPELLKRAGVDRRLHTAGQSKASLDPFSEQKEEDVAHLKTFLDEIHEYFRKQVRERRHGKLKGDEATLFSGKWWSGGTALELGLIDGLGDARGVLRQRYGENVKLKVIGESKSWWMRWMGLRAGAPGLDQSLDLAPRVASRLGPDLAESLIAAVEERLIWSRFGL